MTTTSKMITCLFWICFLALNSYAQEITHCPTRCTCSTALGKVDCSNKGFTSPPDLSGLRGVRVLDLDLSNNPDLSLSDHSIFDGLIIDSLKLSHCGLTTLPEGLFSGARVTILYLDNNPIKFYNHELSFKGLENSLQYLVLRHCNLLSVPSKQLSILLSLVELDLSQNTVLHIVQTDFMHFHARRIYLNDNGLKTIDKNSFNRVPVINYLDLSNNSITDLSFLWQLCKFKDVNLSGNPLNCDCQFIVNRKFQIGDTYTGVCASPKELEGVALGSDAFMRDAFKLCRVGGVPEVECYTPQVSQDSTKNHMMMDFQLKPVLRLKTKETQDVHSKTNSAVTIQFSLNLCVAFVILSMLIFIR